MFFFHKKADSQIWWIFIDFLRKDLFNIDLSIILNPAQLNSVSGNCNPGPQSKLSRVFLVLPCFKSQASNDCHHHQASEEWWRADSGVFKQSNMENMQVSVPWGPGLGNPGLLHSLAWPPDCSKWGQSQFKNRVQIKEH